MAIVTMCASTDPGAYRDDYWSKQSGSEIFLVRSYEGLVLSLGEMNGYDDSDFYAVVWDDAAGAPKRVTYATTRGWTYANGASVDATAAVKAKYALYCAAREEAAAAARAARIAATPTKGARVKVVSGRKIAKGTEAEVFWYGPAGFGRKSAGYRSPSEGVKDGYRVGLRLPDGAKVFTAATNVAVIAEAGA